MSRQGWFKRDEQATASEKLRASLYSLKSNKTTMYSLVSILLASVVLLNGCDLRSNHVQINIQNAFDKDNIIPLVILGSGPAGLSAAIYGVWSNIRTLVIQGPTPGG